MKIEIKKKEATSNLTIRAPKYLLEKLSSIAKKNGVSQAKLVVAILDKALSEGIRLK